MRSENRDTAGLAPCAASLPAAECAGWLSALWCEEPQIPLSPSHLLLWVQTYSFFPVTLCQFHFFGLNGVSRVPFAKVQTSGKDGPFIASRIEIQIQYMIISSGRRRSVSVRKGKWIRQGVSQMGRRQPDQGAFSLLCRVVLQLARGPVLCVCFFFFYFFFEVTVLCWFPLYSKVIKLHMYMCILYIYIDR